MGKRILVIEDEEDNRQILRDLLGRAGYEMIEAETGEAGVTAAISERPDLILMDVQLPIMDGHEASRRIKANPELRAIPLIAITAYALSGDEPQRWPQAAMPMCPSRTARVTCWRKSGNS
jgi:two-component system cell cycle response regulator DivK